MMMAAALAAAQLTGAASPALASDLPREEAAADRVAKLGLADGQAPAASRAGDAQDEELRKKKRKSTADKVLTGAAVVLGIGALAVGGPLVAIFVN